MNILSWAEIVEVCFSGNSHYDSVVDRLKWKMSFPSMPLSRAFSFSVFSFWEGRIFSFGEGSLYPFPKPSSFCPCDLDTLITS